MRTLGNTLLLFAMVTLAAALFATSPLPDEHGTVHAQGAQLRIVVPMVSRDVLPDLTLEPITVLRSDITEAEYRYRISNIGDGPADLARFTMQAWFSADDMLQKGVDLEAGTVGFTVMLAPGATLEAVASAGAPSGNITAYPYLVLELDSAGAVFESRTDNNVRATLRPPLDLVGSVQLAWDDVADAATVTWTFAGAAHGIPDNGFRVDVPGFGIQELPAGTRMLVIPFNPFTGARPCIARVAALRADADPWPVVESNRLCQ